MEIQAVNRRKEPGADPKSPPTGRIAVPPSASVKGPLGDFEGHAAEIEAGRFPACFPDREAAAAFLIDLVCSTPWETPEERSRAQSLVRRIARSARPGEGWSTMPAAGKGK